MILPKLRSDEEHNSAMVQQVDHTIAGKYDFAITEHIGTR